MSKSMGSRPDLPSGQGACSVPSLEVSAGTKVPAMLVGRCPAEIETAATCGAPTFSVVRLGRGERAVVMPPVKGETLRARFAWGIARTLARTDTDPSYANAHHWYADFLAGRGRLTESLSEFRRAYELDPLSAIIALNWRGYFTCSVDRMRRLRKLTRCCESIQTFGTRTAFADWCQSPSAPTRTRLHHSNNRSHLAASIHSATPRSVTRVLPLAKRIPHGSCWTNYTGARRRGSSPPSLSPSRSPGLAKPVTRSMRFIAAWTSVTCCSLRICSPQFSIGSVRSRATIPCSYEWESRARSREFNNERHAMTLPAEPSAPTDFDFMIGQWRVRHRRLNARLAGCTDWTEFDGLSTTTKVLGGFGNIEDNILRFPSGDVRAIAMRSFDPETRTWSIWWLDGRSPHRLDPPVVGGFTGTTGVFLTDDTLDGKPIKVRFLWTVEPGHNPRWEQAFSPDSGATWETNWTMEFVRV